MGVKPPLRGGAPRGDVTHTPRSRGAAWPPPPQPAGWTSLRPGLVLTCPHSPGGERAESVTWIEVTGEVEVQVELVPTRGITHLSFYQTPRPGPASPGRVRFCPAKAVGAQGPGAVSAVPLGYVGSARPVPEGLKRGLFLCWRGEGCCPKR